MNRIHPLPQLRANNGSQIAEFGPALFIVLIIGLFPMLDLVYLGTAYCCGYYLNQMEAREAAISRPPAQSTRPPYSYSLASSSFANEFPELYTKIMDFSSSGIAKFIGLNSAQECLLYQEADPNAATNVNGWAILKSDVTTRIEVRPLLQFKNGFFNHKENQNQNTVLHIPGLTDPVYFQYYSQQLQEQRLPGNS